LIILDSRLRGNDKIVGFMWLCKRLWFRSDQRLRFLLVGIWNTIFGYLAFVFLDYIFNIFLSPLYVAYMTAAVLSNILAITNAYFFHKHITFRSDVRGVRSIYEYFRFSTTYLVTFIFSMILLPILVELFHLAPQLAVALILAICTIVSYLGHSRFSFKRH